MAVQTVTSSAIASQHLGVSVELIKAARRHPACEAFTSSGRINLEKLKAFVDTHLEELQEAGDDSLAKWKTQLTKNQALIAEKELEKLQGKYVLRVDVDHQLKAIALAQRNLLKNQLLNELPQKLVGLTSPQITVVLENVLNDICGLMENLEIKDD